MWAGLAWPNYQKQPNLGRFGCFAMPGLRVLLATAVIIIFPKVTCWLFFDDWRYSFEKCVVTKQELIESGY